MAVRRAVVLASEQGQDPELRGIQRLAGAILVQAIEDIRCSFGRKKIDALQWIEDSWDGQFSFVFCCRVLNRNPDEVRRFLNQQEIPSWFVSARIGSDSAASI